MVSTSTFIWDSSKKIMVPIKTVQEAVLPPTVMATVSNSSATYLLLMNILLLGFLDVLYYIHSLASAHRNILFFSVRRRSTTVRLSILGLALAITLHKIVTNLVVHHESLVICARFIYDSYAHYAPVNGGILVFLWVSILAIHVVLKWHPAIWRMLRSGPGAPVEKHVPFAKWSIEERLVLRALKSRRLRQQQQRSNEKEQSEAEILITPATKKGTFRDVAEPNQVLQENAESRGICALLELNILWLLMAAVEWYMASGEFGVGDSFAFTISVQVMEFSFLSMYYWLDCLITWGEALVEVRRARH